VTDAYSPDLVRWCQPGPALLPLDRTNLRCPVGALSWRP